MFLSRGGGVMMLMGAIVLGPAALTLGSGASRALFALSSVALAVIGYRSLRSGVVYRGDRMIEIRSIKRRLLVPVAGVEAVRVVSIAPIRGAEAFQIAIKGGDVHLVWSDAPGYDEPSAVAIQRFRRQIGLDVAE